MLRCDQCKEVHPDDVIHLSEEGKYMCEYCLALRHPHPLLVENELGSAGPLDIDPAHRCTVCGVEWVDSDNGFDTCEYCQKRRAV